MSESIRICYTGPRPQTLGSFDNHDRRIFKIGLFIYETTFKFIEQQGKLNKYHIIVGGAQGIDKLALEQCLLLREQFNITIEVALPYKKYGEQWPVNSQEEYQMLLQKVDKITYVDELRDYNIEGVNIGEYDVAKLSTRNHYMVDNTEHVLAYWNGTSKGTGECIAYAMQRKREVHLFSLNPILNEFLKGQL